MKIYKLILVSLVLISFQLASAQVEFSVSVNPTTGAHTIIDSIPGVKWITHSPSYTTFDRINGRYIFRGADADMNWGLYSVDVTTGNVVSSPVFPVLADPNDNVVELQFDNSSGNLYGLHWDASAQTEFLVSVNPTTGVHTIIDSIPGVKWITHSPSYTTFDHINGRYIFRGADADMNWGLYSVDVTTGNVISSPVFPVLADPNDNVVELQFDNSSGNLYGLYWDASAQTEFLVSVNPTTGVHTIIDSIPGVKWITHSPKYTTFDHINGRYILRGADAGMNWGLYSVDVTTCNVVSSPVFPILADPNDNVVELQFDNSSGNLYGLYWDADFVLGIDDLQIVDNAQLYPNPFHDKITVEFNEIQPRLSLKVFDSKGKLIMVINKNSMKKIEIHKGNLNAGVYFFQISSDKVNSVRKVIIE